MKYPIQVLFREYFEGILAAVFLAVFLRFFVLSILYMPTDNMQPGLQKGDFVIGWRLSYGFPLPLMKGERLNYKVPLKGDVVAFRFPGDEEQIIIRRVIGHPGDRVKIVDGVPLVNDQALEQVQEPGAGLFEVTFDGRRYQILSNSEVQMNEVVVPKDRLFVLSDNRFRTDDSRDWGFVPFNHVESELMLIWLSMDNSETGLNILWPRIFKAIE